MYRNMHQVYIIYSSSKDRYYVGSTSVGVQLRVDRHNEGWTKSTRSGIPWELKYIKSFDVKTAALKYELFLKRQKSRPFLEKLITSEENELSW
ncbi:MAG: GIY-YIG nuclease family protein [Bacteroidota bacterium]